MQLLLSSALVALVSTPALANPLQPRNWHHRVPTQAFSSAPAATGTGVPVVPSGVVVPNTTVVPLDPNVVNCFVTAPSNLLTAEGLATPWLLQPPCSMTVPAQQAFVEAAIIDPDSGAIGIYHPLVTDAGKKPALPPVPVFVPRDAVVGIWLGFNGGILQMNDIHGLDTNTSPILKGANCINGLPGTKGDVFGQVSWCNAQQWFAAANQGVRQGKIRIPPLGVDSLGNACPTSRSFEITDACPSDNVPTQYLLTATGQTAQDTALGAKLLAAAGAMVINNASDEALLANILDPLINCKPFQAPSLDNLGTMANALALSELQAAHLQAAPIGLVPLNDPDCLLTADQTVSTAKTNAYRLGVNQLVIGPATTTNGTDPTGITGALVPYCNNMVAVAPPFLKGFQAKFSNQASPAADVGNNLFTFLCNRYLMSLTQLHCPPAPFQPVVCNVVDGVATSCTITLQNTNTTTPAAPITTGTATGVNGTAAAPVGTGTTGMLPPGLTGTNNGVAPVAPPAPSTCTFAPVAPVAPVATPSASPTVQWGGRHRYERA